MESLNPQIISCIATAVIAIATVINVILILSINARDNRYKSDVKDLYQAIVVSNLLTAPRGEEGINKTIKVFKDKYKGKVAIVD